MRRPFHDWILVALMVTACADLETRPEAVCGNGVVEPGNDEFCDGEPGCVDPNLPEACRFSCAQDQCPDGLACGLDQVCRAPGYELERGLNLGDGEVAHVLAEDFDGDGRDDLVWVEGSPGGLRGNLHVAYFNSRDQAETGYSLESTPARVSTGDADGDSRPDLILSDLPGGGPNLKTLHAAVLRNDGARGFIPAVATTPEDMVEVDEPGGVAYLGFDYVSDDGDIDVIETHVAFIDGDRVVATGAPPVPALKIAPTAVTNCQGAWIGGAFEVGAFAAVMGNPNEFGSVDDATVELYPWRIEDEAGELAFEILNEPVLLALPDGTNGALPWIYLDDSDGDEDELAELLVQTVSPSRLWTSFAMGDGLFDGDGDGNADQTISTPFLEMPVNSRVLVAEDLNDDSRLDFISGSGIALSGTSCTDNGPDWDCDCDLFDDEVQYSCNPVFLNADPGPPVRFSDVAVADLDGDGQIDFVGLEQLDEGPGALIPFVASAAGEWTNTAPIGLANAVEVEHGLVNDDLRVDVLIRTQDPDTGLSELWVIWGEELFDEEPAKLLSGLRSTPGVRVSSRSNLDLPLYDGQRVGRAQLGLVGNEKVASLFRVWPDDVFDQWGPPFPNPRVVNARAGHFASPDVASLVLGGWSHGDTIDSHSEQAVAARMTPNAAGGVDFVVDSVWEAFGTPGFSAAGLPALHKHASAAGTYLSADFDGDGTDQLVIVGSGGPSESGTGFIAQGPGFVTAFEFDDDEWVRRSQLTLNELTVGGEWPRVENPNQAMIEDVDGDGDPDVFMLANATRSHGATAFAVVRSVNGYLSLKVESVQDLALGIDAWSFLGVGPDDMQRVAYVSNGRLNVGALDGEDLSVDEQHDQAVPALVNWSTSGDFDGDGLEDLALATSDGVAIYWSVPAGPTE